MKEHAQVVIIGAGILGCSVAYHLTRLGWKDVLIIEKGQETSGSTWHAAGLVGQLRSKRNITRMLTHSVDLYSRLEEETGQPTGWNQVGSLRLACSEGRMIELKKAATTAKSFGLEMQLISPKEAQDLFPVMALEGVVGAAYMPTDGHIDPSSVTYAMAKGARDEGASIARNTKVTGLTIKNRRVTEVHTDKGTVRAEFVVNTAGMWAREIGKMAGVNIPLMPCEHHYIVTEKIANLPKDIPTMRDPDKLVYYKEDNGGLAMGGYECNPRAWSVHGIPADFGQELLEPDYDHFEQLATLAMERTPVLGEVGIRKCINGPEAFTPDGNPVMGRAPELDNFFVAAGFNAHGIASGGGAGKMLAEWIVHEEPELDLWSVDIRRFGNHHKSLDYVKDRTLELYAKHYTMGWPHEEHSSVRNLRKSPLYETLKSHGCSFGQKFGWERPNWFAPKGVEPVDDLTFARPNWFQHVANEHKAIREGVALIDQTSFSKFDVYGKGALKALQYIAANDIDKPIGSLTYTQLCNSKGGIEADLTIGRIAENQFYIVTGTAFGDHDFAWISKNLEKFDDVVGVESTSSRAVINVCGPNSRNLLEKITYDDISNEGLRFGHVKEIFIGAAPARALRVTYVGELGYELHIPTEYASYVYERLWEAGQDFDIKNAGYRAIESCRLEKGYRYWSSDITPDYTPFEAGLGFCVNFEKDDFIGREKLLEQKENGVSQKLACFTLDKDRELLGGETILLNGEVLGVLTSGGYGHTIQKPIAYGYVPKAAMKETSFEIEVLGERIPAAREKGSLYDPKRERILA